MFRVTPAAANTILVTGAAGFVGSAVVRHVVPRVAAGMLKFSDGSPVQHVAALVRPGANLERLEELKSASGWSVEAADLADASQLRSLLDRVRPRAIVHVALDRAAYEDLPAAEIEHRVLNPLRTLAGWLAETPGARFIHTGSAWVLPAGESLDESSPLAPVTPYARVKVMEEELLAKLSSNAQLQWIVLRLFNIFGRFENPRRLLPYLVAQLARGESAELSDAAQVRDFTDVDAMATAYALAVAAPGSACGRVYHIGCGRGLSLREFTLVVAEVMGHTGRVQFGTRRTPDSSVPVQVANASLAARALGWAPAHDVRADIRRAVEWWSARLGVVRPAGDAAAKRI
ncbi:MAG TPA: NAD-dependent epimerase/dehydratase [Candidatus Acidoferrales bacterium]